VADTAGSSWGEFETASPALAGTGLRLLYQGSDLASAFLATVAPDGGPRVHPVFPVVSGGQLWLFIVNMSPKYRDLVRNASRFTRSPYRKAVRSSTCVVVPNTLWMRQLRRRSWQRPTGAKGIWTSKRYSDARCKASCTRSGRTGVLNRPGRAIQSGGGSTL
jgi:hypothetical protein